MPFFSLPPHFLIFLLFSSSLVASLPRDSDEWKYARATYYAANDPLDTLEWACGYGDLAKNGYGLSTVALSGALFGKGEGCGGCYELRCVEDLKWCIPGTSMIVTATNFCPPNYALPVDSGGWCNPPNKHFVMPIAVFEKIAIWKAGCWGSGLEPTHCATFKSGHKGNPRNITEKMLAVRGNPGEYIKFQHGIRDTSLIPCILREKQKEAYWYVDKNVDRVSRSKNPLMANSCFDLKGISQRRCWLCVGILGNTSNSNTGNIPVIYRRIKCVKAGGIRFTLNGFGYFYSVLITNVAGAGDVVAVKMKGSNTGWLQMGRNWGQNWHCNADLSRQALSFEVTTGDGRTITSYNVAPSNWQFGQTYEGKQFSS